MFDALFSELLRDILDVDDSMGGSFAAESSDGIFLLLCCIVRRIL